LLLFEAGASRPQRGALEFGLATLGAGGGASDFFLAQPVFVAAGILAPLAGTFVNESRSDDVVEEGAIVRHDEQRALELQEQIFEQLERFEIEIVGRFVQHQQVARSREDLRELEPPALATRQLATDLGFAPARTEVAQIADDMAFTAAHRDHVTALGDVFDHRFGLVEDIV
jgi:hypothetical protein